MFKSYSMELGGRTHTLEFGKYAEQASGSCFVRYGDTCVLTTCTVAKTPRPGIDFFPLSVDFEEKLYSVGHIPGSWNRREGRPAEKAILTSRLIDRPLRPLFPKGMRHDVSVVATVMSVDTNNIPDIPAMIGASASLATSEIPWAGPIGAVNIGYVELVGASLLMLVAGIVSWRMGLGQSRRIAVSTVRAFLQLLAMGLLLGYLFKYQTWWLVCLVLLGMCIAATQIATGRTNKVVRGLWADVFLSITVSSMVIAFIVVEGIIHADPWYNAMQLVPISGMILGNTLAAAAVATDRLFASMDSRANEIYMMVALGATPREAAFPSIKAAVGAGMTPLLAQLSAAGIVQIPGMMSGQILAGADPVIAAKYQIVVLLMISAATTLSVVIICFLAYKKRFSTEGYYLSPALRDDAGGAA